MYLANFFSNLNFLKYWILMTKLFFSVVFIFCAFQIDSLSKLFSKMRKKVIFHLEKKIKIHKFGYFFHFFQNLDWLHFFSVWGDNQFYIFSGTPTPIFIFWINGIIKFSRILTFMEKRKSFLSYFGSCFSKIFYIWTYILYSIFESMLK